LAFFSRFDSNGQLKETSVERDGSAPCPNETDRGRLVLERNPPFGERMMFKRTFRVCVASLAVLLLVVACSDQATEPNTDIGPEFTTQAKLGHCPSGPDLVVTTEAELRAAMDGGADEGDVIAIEGLIPTDKGAWTFTDGITITCATPGSGLVADPNPDWAPGNSGYLLRIYGKDVTVTGLVLDALLAPGGPIFAHDNGGNRHAENVAFTNNQAICGPGSCAMFHGVTGAIIAENTFDAYGSGTGVHVQGIGPRDENGQSPRPIDGSIIERNTVIAHEPQPEGCPWCGGIRPRDGRHVVVDHNTVVGPWLNSISTAEFFDSEVKSNRLEDAIEYGIAVTRNRNSDFSAVGNTFQNNDVRGAGVSGVRVQWACSNRFQGNSLNHNPSGIGLEFIWNTGANTLSENKNVVVDEGYYDCDGDGETDPNLITGSGKVLPGFTGTTYTNPVDFQAAIADLGTPTIIDFEDIDASPVNNTYLGRDPFDGSSHADEGIIFSNLNAYPLYLAPGGLFWNASNSLSVRQFPFDSNAADDTDDDLVVSLNPPTIAVGFTLVDNGSAGPDEFALFIDANGDVVQQVAFPSDFAPYRAFLGIVSADRPIAKIYVVEAPHDGDDVDYDDFIFVH
jgi:hypothetical protein